MAKKDAATGVDIRWGFTALLPVSFVEPIRDAMTLAQKRYEAQKAHVNA
jgi:hypothetical protein